MKRSANKKYFYLLFFIALAVGGYFWGGRSSSRHPTGLGKVIREDLIQRVTLAGIVSPNRKTIITAPYNGYVKRLFVKVGDKIKKDDPLVSVVQSLQSSEDVFPMRAPFGGLVVQVQKMEGEFVKEGNPEDFILRIDDLDKLYVMAMAPEIDRVKIVPNQEAVIKASALPQQTYKGVIRELSLAAKQKEEWSRSQVVEFPIRIELLDKDDKIKPGMSVIIDVLTNKKEKVLTLRHEYIQREDDQYFVMLKDGKRRDIKVGLQNEEGFEILEGLREGEMVKLVDFTAIQ